MRVRGQVKKPVIMAVDDRPELLKSLVTMLKHKYDVIGFTKPYKALSMLDVHSPALFLLDIDMPEIKGYDLAAMIRRNPNYAETPIIFLTAMGTRNDVITAISHGGNDYIIKPVRHDVLMAKLERYIGS